MRTPVLIVLAAFLSLAACSGSGSSGGSTPPVNTGGGNGGGAQTQSEAAIDTTNALGDPLKSMDDYNQSVSGADSVARTNGSVVTDITPSTCVSGVEFFSPDKNGDANSTESQYFYDSACTELARDNVRIYSMNGTSETVNFTGTEYALNNATPTAQRTLTQNFINGTYGTYGFPVVADGFARSETGSLSIGGSKTIVSDDELVVSAGSGGVNGYCGDSAGFNATGIASLNETFGWQGQSSAGTRTVNSGGSVTWQTTRAGNTAKGAIGSLSINAGTANTACPISTPEYTLVGGTAQGNYSIPITTTYTNGELTGLTVTNASLANGNTLNVTTNTSVSPSNTQFITGIVSSGSTQIATFNANTFGSGVLTVTSNGAQFVIDDWHVIR
jgi:hypothetical protein